MAKWVYMFTEGNATMRNLLGGKGANLAEMTNLGLQYHRASQLPQRLVLSTMRMEEKLTTKSRHRSWNPSQRWKKLQVRNSEIKKTRFLYLFVQEQGHQCRV